MTIFIAHTNYWDDGIFGVYSSIKRARIAIEDFLKHDYNIKSYEDIGNYCYTFTTLNDEQFGIEIKSDVLDLEFNNGILEDK